MVQRARIEIEDGVHRVYNRIARGEPDFPDAVEAAGFIETVRDTTTRNALTVSAWSVRSEHYRPLTRIASLSLWRGMHRIRTLFSRRFNERHDRAEGLWQSRDKLMILKPGTHTHTRPVGAQ